MPSETSKTYLQHLVASALSELKMTALLDRVDITTPDPRFGDYSTNVALVLAKRIKEDPKLVAEKIAQKIGELDKDQKLERIEVKAGFINFAFSQKFLAGNLEKIITEKDLYGCSLEGQGKKVVFEYSSPNTNKPLHIGHTRNDLYGTACINLLKATGHKVVSCEIINDRGIHIMKSMMMYQKFGEGATPTSANTKPDHFVGKFYTMFAQQASESKEKEEALMAEAQELLRKWEAGDAEVRKLWEQMNAWWYEGVKVTYEREGSHFDEVDHESEIYDKGRELVLGGVKKGVFTKEDDGSVSVDLSSENLDKKTLLRKDGTTLYITQDMYLWHLRDERHHPDSAIVTTSSEQTYHFKVLKRVFELLGFSWAQNFRHLPYEHVYLGSGKMSSREGNTITADELVDQVKGKVRELMKTLEKLKGSTEDDELVEKVAYGAIKYGYLKYEPNTRIYFDLDQTIALEGNTGIYLQYAHARMCSILRKADGHAPPSAVPKSLQPAELAVTRMLLHFGERISAAAFEYKPNLLCNYLYELASCFSTFYNEVPVLQEKDDELRSFRLNLITATAQVIKNGLNLLGIEAPEEM